MEREAPKLTNAVEFRPLKLQMAEEWKEREGHELASAMEKQFNQMYGKDQHEVASWQKLCLAVDIDPAPDTIEECQKVRHSISSLS